MENLYIYSVQELSLLDDNDLKDLFLKIRSNIFLEKKIANNTKELEIYYCYICKEIEERENKK
tara:strand:- start:249 stop:437 length:189 start_codon:yes stop_codon:yes gene_type:complete